MITHHSPFFTHDHSVVTPDAWPVVTSDAWPVVTPDAWPVVTPDAWPVVTPDAWPVVTLLTIMQDESHLCIGAVILYA